MSGNQELEILLPHRSALSALAGLKEGEFVAIKLMCFGGMDAEKRAQFCSALRIKP